MDIKKGQKIWINHRTGIKETIVKSSGNKYITTEFDDRIKFDKTTLKQVNGVGCAYSLILDIEEYLKDQYYNTLVLKLRKMEWGTVKREDLDKINNILFGETKSTEIK